jgi:toxin YoeB
MKFKLELSKQFIKDIEHYRRNGDINSIKKIKSLLEEMMETPYQGLGKPEPLKYNLSGV